MRCTLSSLELARAIVEALEEKKGEDILLMDIHEIASFADYFVICNGTSDRMLDALAKTVEETSKQKFRVIAREEGLSGGGWVLVDAGDVVVHLFSPELRDYYQLEKLWEHGRVLVRVK